MILRIGVLSTSYWEFCDALRAVNFIASTKNFKNDQF